MGNMGNQWMTWYDVYKMNTMICNCSQIELKIKGHYLKKHKQVEMFLQKSS